MGSITIVEDYINAAMAIALYEEVDEDGIAATVPGFTGVIAITDDKESCAAELSARLEEWIQLALEQAYPLPVLNGIDLNSERGVVLANYHDYRSAAPKREIFADAEAFEAFLAKQPHAS